MFDIDIDVDNSPMDDLFSGRKRTYFKSYVALSYTQTRLSFKDILGVPGLISPIREP